jgi:hypothetical protein
MFIGVPSDFLFTLRSVNTTVGVFEVLLSPGVMRP